MEYSILVRPDYFDDHEKSLAKQTKSIGKVKAADDIKLALYRQENYRKRLLKEKGQEILIKPKRGKQSSSTSTQSGSSPIISTLPTSLQAKGENFLHFLQSMPNFRVNEKGEIVYDNRHIEGSRIVDIVHDFVRERPSRSPAKGWQLVAEALKENNVPREFIGNRSRWQYIQNLTDPFSPTPTSTPRRSSLSKTLSDLQTLRRQLQFQSGSGIGKALKSLKWKTH